MTPALQEKISRAILKLHEQGVKANLVVLGYEEEIQLEGDNPKEGIFGCEILIDGNAKTRCSVFGQVGKDYVVPNPKRR